MKTCIKCGSHAFNLYAEGIDQGGFCDVHYWQGRAHRAEALAQDEKGLFIDLIAQHEGLAKELAQPEQEPVCEITVKNGHWIDTNGFSGVKDLANGIHKLYTTPPKEQRSCDKRPWVGLTEDEVLDVFKEKNAMKFARNIEAALKEKNT